MSILIKQISATRAKYKAPSGRIFYKKIESSELTLSKIELQIYNTYIHRAKKKNLMFSLHIGYFKALINGNCYYCGFKQLNKLNGIDRQDSSLGYLTTNTVSCCSLCNRAKHLLSETDYIAWLNRISKKSHSVFLLENELVVIGPIIRMFMDLSYKVSDKFYIFVYNKIIQNKAIILKSKRFILEVEGLNLKYTIDNSNMLLFFKYNGGSIPKTAIEYGDFTIPITINNLLPVKPSSKCL